MDDLATLIERRARWSALLNELANGIASHSTGDRSYSKWDPRTVQDVIDKIDAQIAALESPRSGGVTYLRARRAR